MEPVRLTSPEGVDYRDLNGNGRMDPFEDPRLPVEERVEDLLGRLSLEEKVGLMFQTVIEAGADGTVLEQPGAISKSPTSVVVLDKHLSHFNVHALDDAADGGAVAQRPAGARRADAARHPGHDLDRPAARVHRERRCLLHGQGVLAVARAARTGGAAGRRTPCAGSPTSPGRSTPRSGIRAALHPTLDLATEPRWARQAGTFGQDPDLVTELGVAYLKGFQGDSLGPGSVACTSKHFPGGGPQKDGEDAHFPYGREQVYPGGRFADHLKPFPPIIEAGTAAIMPYYGMPVGLEIDGEKIEEVGFGYNSRSSPGCCASSSATTAWSSPTGSSSTTTTSATRCCRPGPGASSTSTRTAGWSSSSTPAPTSSAARSASTSCSTSSRRAGSARRAIDESARRLLAVKFRLGLFDDPFVDEDAAAADGRAAQDFRDEGYAAQARSVTVLQNGTERRAPCCRCGPGLRIYAENVSPEAVAAHGVLVDRPEDADVALVRLMAPFEPRSDLFLESWFHQGSLDFPPGLVARLARIAAHVPARRRRRARPAGRAHAAARRRRRGRRQLRHERRRPAGRADRHHRARRAAAVRPAALDGAGAPARRGRARATTTRCSPSATASASDPEPPTPQPMTGKAATSSGRASYAGESGSPRSSHRR